MTKELPALNDIDELMNRLSDPEYLSSGMATKSGDIAACVLYHRNIRAAREAGKGKAVRRANAGTAKLDIASLMSSIVTASGVKPTATSGFKRRV